MNRDTDTERQETRLILEFCIKYNWMNFKCFLCTVCNMNLRMMKRGNYFVKIKYIIISKCLDLVQYNNCRL